MSVRKIGVIGTGRVGTGLAALSVSRGLPTVVVGHSREGLLKCRDALIDHLEELTRLGWLREPDRYGALERLEITDAWEELTGAELVFEAVREERAIKQAVLRKAEEYLDSRTPLLSCTSSLLPSELAALAVWFHGKAGDKCAEKLGEYAMLPSDLVEAIPEVLREHTEPS